MISVKNISKKYKFSQKIDSLQKFFGGFFNGFSSKKKEKAHFFALKNISFEVKKGEILGIIGRNGAGKSTLLKILSRIEKPSEGEAILEGTLQSLLEVGTGFHQDLTGRENIWLNGGLLGMSYLEIQSKFDQIVAFSELSAFIDMPINQYSSGMAIRLAFSVAVHLDSDILILDEVLAVGDDAFQKKCIQKILDFKENQKTILLVSHQLSLVQKLCTRVIWLDKGEIQCDDSPQIAIEKYLFQQISANNIHNAYQNTPQNTNFDLSNAQRTNPKTLKNDVQIKKVQLNQHIYFPSDVWQISIFLDKDENINVKDISISVAIFNQFQERIYHLNNVFLDKKWDFEAEKAYIFQISPLRLHKGVYSVNLFLEANQTLQDWVQQQVHFEVQTGHIYSPTQHFDIRALVQTDFSCV